MSLARWSSRARLSAAASGEVVLTVAALSCPALSCPDPPRDLPALVYDQAAALAIFLLDQPSTGLGNTQVTQTSCGLALLSFDLDGRHQPLFGCPFSI